VPFADAAANARRLFSGVTAVIVVVLAALLAVVNATVYLTVVHPLRQMTRHVNEVSLGQATGVTFASRRRGDEIAALAEAFDCGVNDLPLSLVLSWYEQKAVAILLTLLWLGVKNIRIGPTLPAFLSPAVLELLHQNYNLMPTTTVDADLAAIFA